MGKIKDFPCTYDNSSGVNAEVTKGLDLTFPEAYCQAEMMAVLSKALKEHDQSTLCELPFCHTLEADALGAVVNLGNAATGPRIKEYSCSSLEEVLELPPIDFSQGRIAQTLRAAELLIAQGEDVFLEVSGPVTILTSLVDPRVAFKALRKQRDLAKEVLWKLGGEVVRFVEEAQECGVRIFSWADVSAAVNILGPKLAEQVVEDFTYDYLKNHLVKATEGTSLVVVCPKTSFALIGCEKASFRNVELPEPLYYSQACKYLVGKVALCGHNCIKNTKYFLDNSLMKELVLL